MLPANDPSLQSWVKISSHSDFPIQNLPFGIFKTPHLSSRVGVAIGEYILDLAELVQSGFFDSIPLSDKTVFSRSYLNDFISLGQPVWRKVRNRISELLRIDCPELRDNKDLQKKILIPMDQVTMSMPVKIPNYTDFYSSIEHASNVGSLFRDPQNPLLPNWKHLPVAYHGRASSIIISDIPIHRPKGQTKKEDESMPTFGPTKALDFELELGFIIGKPTSLGESVSTQQAEDHIFGFVLFNDWSARDIQKWEYVPLGPFLAKNFASSISPWVVTLDALESFRANAPTQDPQVLPYLQMKENRNFDIQLEVLIQPKGDKEISISKTNFKNMYWSIHQQLAHHTVNGCNIEIGDMMASGTISGKEENAYGSMLELTFGGKKPLKLSNGMERTYIQDGDTIIMRGYSEKNGIRIGFGEVRTLILPTL